LKNAERRPDQRQPTRHQRVERAEDQALMMIDKMASVITAPHAEIFFHDFLMAETPSATLTTFAISP